jgi:hypothetical protein
MIEWGKKNFPSPKNGRNGADELGDERENPYFSQKGREVGHPGSI